MIYDCFTFFNELDLLEIRLNILNDAVDKFVLVEAAKTFNNKDKPLYFNENKERFKLFEDKIIHIIVNEFPFFQNAWVFEYHQRNSIKKGLIDCKDDDIILISDLDEIPNPTKIKEYKNYLGIRVFKQKMFYYFINNININNPYWANISTKMLSFGDFKKYELSAQKIRLLKGLLIDDGGWHFSYLGGVEAIALKIQSFAHQEYNSNEYTELEKIKLRITNGKDLFERKGFHYAAIKIDRSFPKYIIDNQQKYNNLICDENISFIEEINLIFNKTKDSIILLIKQMKNKALNKI